ncbi:hypothetical protein SH1V18_32150 [Vallitalea longa]|uniref:HTH araC/xylS-type domain-containing protein n=1 Tax=Vallitalea longa TaxID=2936439 RepID=A0A9W6DFM2_9FIRM|nr:AraC family transcriptional regulator [Vallitalea longa]GKX30735.1 hypothetical protein SH1V18_32150 [Vallitalea longa]
MNKKNSVNERCIVDFSIIDKDFSFTLGKVNYIKARQPLNSHIHENKIEIVYIVKGEQIYNVKDKDYMVRSGECFIVYDNELHSTGSNPEDKADFYYFIIDLYKHKNNFIGYGDIEGDNIVNLINIDKKRVFKGSTKIADILDKLIQIPFMNVQYKKTIIRNLVSELLLNIIECKNTHDTGYYNNTMQNITDYIEENIYSNISISELVAICGLSETRFKTKFKKQFGMPPHEYILRKKISTSKILLNSTDMTITDVAFTLSFSSSQYFATVFKRFTSISPKDYKKLSTRK